jgi:glycosyltransferase involved in cell wall biosynthesis
MGEEIRNCKDTCTIAAGFSAQVVKSKRGRGKQMNDAVACATGDNLLFLHADSRLDDHELLSNVLGIQATVDNRTAGHFPPHFMRSTKRNAMADRAPLIFYPIRRSKLRY